MASSSPAADIVYWYTSYDPTGTTALALAVGLCLLIGFYLLFTGRRLPMRPEDDNEGEIVQGTGEVGFFSPHSWWPFWVGLAAASTAVGFAIGWWMVLIGVVAIDVRVRRLRLRVLPRPLQPLGASASEACPRLSASIGRGSGGLRVSRGLAGLISRECR